MHCEAEQYLPIYTVMSLIVCFADSFTGFLYSENYIDVFSISLSGRGHVKDNMPMNDMYSIKEISTSVLFPCCCVYDTES